MVLQEKVSVICMLTQTKEDGKDKCFQYWPITKGSSLKYNDIVVINAHSMVYADYVYSTLHVQSQNSKHTVEHMHFVSWSDHGVTQYPESLVSFLRKFQNFESENNPKIVHCSAGVGRTGTIILADICIKMAQKTQKIDVLYHQKRIRKQRANLVDNNDQYKLVHMIILESLFGASTSIPCVELRKYVTRLKHSKKAGEELRKLAVNSWKDDYTKGSQDAPAQPDIERKENRNRIVPGCRGRVFISRFPLSNADSDYINAVVVDGFRMKAEFIATQFPLEHTIGDFWRMVSDKGITLIVVLNEIDTNDNTVNNFIPNEEESIFTLPRISVAFEEMQINDNCKITDVKLQDAAKVTNTSLTSHF
ncbi:receptor-type tyrosine-protein phosphatase C-like [Ctenocephalides felis]|uniref:receptor-type tyrosine-protein phosphatase C-like n=1 Tax=Ctenocephalides felis TaxID=7515 RepID=UPI000E6E1A22|nr:receptor-type tyrosine-protein phosphatase C-like [Ctenocephalides felis]